MVIGQLGISVGSHFFRPLGIGINRVDHSDVPRHGEVRMG